MQAAKYGDTVYFSISGSCRTYMHFNFSLFGRLVLLCNLKKLRKSGFVVQRSAVLTRKAAAFPAKIQH